MLLECLACNSDLADTDAAVESRSGDAPRAVSVSVLGQANSAC